MRKLLYILAAYILTACGSSVPDDVKFDIMKEEPNERLSKNNIEVRLYKKVGENVLKDIALQLREERQQYDNLWIFYYQPGMKSGSPAWATTHFNPDLKVEILGSSDDQDIQTAKVEEIKGEVIGKWRSEKSLMGASLILYKDSTEKLMMKTTFKNGQSMLSEIKEKKQGNTIRYEDDNSHEEYYILESNGNLGMYGKDGKFDEAVKI